MKNLYKYIIVATVLATGCCLASFAQSPEHRQEVMALLKEDPTRSVNLHHNYEAPSRIVDTPAPKGYKPFYVSHYGRHGSRYHYTYSYMDFHQKDRREVFCASTEIQRCIQSMANFCVQLSRENPGLDITMDAGERFKKYLCNDEGVPRIGKREVAIMDSVLNANLNPERLLKAWTKDPGEAVKYMKNGDACAFFYDVIWAGSTGQCLNVEDPYIYRHFTPEELYALWAYNDVRYYHYMNSSVENHRTRDLIGGRILRDIVEKADEAVRGNNRVADLRFGHDSGLGPLFSIMRLKGMEEERKMAEAIDGVWYGFRDMPMASNLQMIFYRNRKGDVLVKLLRNEVETTIPALRSVSGPYYRWDDLRGYLLELVK